MRFSSLLTVLVLATRFASAVDMPGGLMQISDTLKKENYEFSLSPGYVMSPTGAYLTTGLRTQIGEDFGVGVGFGAGEVGFNFGANATWFILPDVESQPAFAVTGGLYFNRLQTGDNKKDNYFVVKVTPMLSKTVAMTWGTVTPYSGLNFAPSFRLNEPQNEMSIKGSFGLMTEVKSLSGIRLWTELDIAIMNSVHEVVFGMSYPFAAI